MADVEIIEADLQRADHAAVVLSLVGQFTRDPMGGGVKLTDSARDALIPGLAAHPTTLVFLAFRDDEAIGIAVCFVGFSTFAAKPLINIHDLFVRDDARGHGVGRDLLDVVTHKSQAIGGCKVTLEVQSSNHRAREIYAAAGFEPAVYQEDAGRVIFLSKSI